jgi:thioredoxin 1
MIKTLGSLEEFNCIIEEQKLNSDKLYLLFYTATWCGPCKSMYPLIERIDVQIPNIYIFKIDVDDDCKEDEEDDMKISNVNDVTCMPTFHLYKNGEIVKKIIGAKKIELLQEIKSNILVNDDEQLKK